MPAAGATVRLASGARHRIAHADPAALARVLAANGAGAVALDASARASVYAQARAAGRGRVLDRPVVKFVLLPLLLAIPAYRLHQIVNFGSSFGEYEAYGLLAYLAGFALWWAAWAIGVVLTASAVRAAVEAGTLASVWLRPGWAVDTRRGLERLGLAVIYLGIPLWLWMRTGGF